jgi:ubiquinone/menaquinone biosynthesis C-methylase UbiE
MNKGWTFGETQRSIRQGWEEVAEEYTKDRSGIFGRSAERLLDLLRPTKGSSLFDVGCGSGAVTLKACSKMGSEGLVIGSDIAGTMLRLGLAAAKERNFNIDFCQMDAEWLGLAPDSFDFVTCAFSLFQFPSMEGALREMWRVLKSGGQLGLSNWGPGYISPIASLQRDLFRKYKIKAILTNPLTFEPRKLDEILTQTGFTTVKLREEQDDVWFASAEEVWAYNMDMGPFPIMLKSQLSIERQEDLFNQFTVMLNDLKTESGIRSTFHLIYATAEKGS